MNDRPEQVVAFVRQTAGPACAVIVTYDTGLTFALAQANLPRTLIVSPVLRPIFGASQPPPGDSCASTRLYTVQSYLGASDPETQAALTGELQSSTHLIQGQLRTNSFSFDPDAARKRALARIPGLGGELASAALLPDYRFVVTSGPIDPAAIEPMRAHMPDFSSDEASSTP